MGYSDDIFTKKPKMNHGLRFMELIYEKPRLLFKASIVYTISVVPVFCLMIVLAGLVSDKISAGYEGDALILADWLVRISVAMFFVFFWGAGPVTAGMTYVMQKCIKDDHVWFLSDFWKGIKDNFIQSTIVLVIDLFAFFAFYAGFTCYDKMGETGKPLLFAIGVALLIYTLMHLYIYPIMVTFKMKLYAMFHNSFLYTIGMFPTTILTFLILAAVYAGGFWICLSSGKYVLMSIVVHFFLIFFFAAAMMMLLISFNAYPKMKKYMMKISDK